jgi:Ca2+-binding EF-hand superfamily protein
MLGDLSDLNEDKIDHMMQFADEDDDGNIDFMDFCKEIIMEKE